MGWGPGVRVAFYTLGCKVNQYDTQAMAARLAEQGHTIVGFDAWADAYVINSCTVTAESDRKARQAIGRAKKHNPSAVVCVCGCYAQRDPQAVLAIDGVDVIAGTTARQDLQSVLLAAEPGKKKNFVHAFQADEPFEEGCGALFERARAHIKIQDGCDRHCTYCAIPQARGPIRSRALPGVQAEAQLAAAHGHQEIVLTGIRLTSFGREAGLSLMDAVEAAAQTDIHRIRLGSLDPDEIDEAFIDRAARCEKLCPHFHLSLQSGCDTVLRRMGRRYTTDAFAHTVDALRAAMPEAAFTTDVMTGFVGETEEEFAQTCAFVRRIGFSKLHVFPYSQRQGTAAMRMPGHLPNGVKQERARRLIEIGQELEQAFLTSLIGTRQEVILEQGKDGWMEGHARNYARLQVYAPDHLPGTCAWVRVEKRTRTGAQAVLLP